MIFGARRGRDHSTPYTIDITHFNTTATATHSSRSQYSFQATRLLEPLGNERPLASAPEPYPTDRAWVSTSAFRARSDVVRWSLSLPPLTLSRHCPAQSAPFRNVMCMT